MEKEIARKICLHEIIHSALNALDKILVATTEIIRPERKFARKSLKELASYEIKIILCSGNEFDTSLPLSLPLPLPLTIAH